MADADVGADTSVEDSSTDTDFVDIEDDSLSDAVAQEAADYLGDDGEDEESEDGVEAKADEDDEGGQEDEEKPEEKPQGKRANKRIQGLISERKELSAKLEEASRSTDHMRQQLAQMQHYSNQQQQQAVERDKQIALAMQKMEFMEKQQSLRDEETLDPVEKLKREAARNGADLARGEWEQKYARLEQQQSQFLQEQRRMHETAETNKRLDGYLSDAENAVGAALQNVEDKYKGALGDKFTSMLMNWCATTGELPQDAVKNFLRFSSTLSEAQRSTRKKKNGDALRKSAASPGSVPNKRRSAKGGKRRPSQAEIEKLGFNDHLEWRAAQDD